MGLTIGITSCILIFLYQQNEINYDKHWQGADKIIKINWEETNNGITDPYSVTSFGTGPSLKENFPEVEQSVRLITINEQTVSYNEKYFNEDRNYLVDTNFFKIFNYALLYGDINTCLKDPNSIVISEAMSKKFFGNTDPIGKTLKYPTHTYKVTGVLSSNLALSHLNPNALIIIDYSSDNMKEQESNFLWLNTFTYLKLKDRSSVINFDEKLKIWAKKTLEPILKKQNVGYSIALKSILISDVHFDTYHVDEFSKSDKNYIYAFGWVALFILIIACFNYMNLSTGYAAKRAKEVGLRKVIGASRKQIIIQFLGESFILSILAFTLSLLLLTIVIPSFNSIANKHIVLIETIKDRDFWFISSFVIIFISIIGGSYPAFYLSNFQPISVFKRKLNTINNKAGILKINLRQLLVVSQFAISIVIIIATIMVYQQLQLMKTKDLGFNKDQVLVINLPFLDSVGYQKISSFKNEILTSNSIKRFSTTNQVLGVSANLLARIREDGKEGQSSINISSGDYDYLDLLNIKLKEGRNFSKDHPTDKLSFILNETAVKFLKLKKPFETELSFNEKDYGKIIGIVKDYNYTTPHVKINPLVITLNDIKDPIGSYALIKLSQDKLSENIEFIAQKWKTFFPHNPISYFFMDELFGNQYKNDNTMLSLFTWFSGLTIFISCLGLFGLASFTTEQRIKEIGIRKVVGASVSNIVYLISKDFLLLVIIAIIIGSPVAFYFTKKWLQNFAYKIDVNAWVFISAGLLIIFIAFITMSYLIIKAALANPVKSLRTE